jgi:hypothetical protein
MTFGWQFVADSACWPRRDGHEGHEAGLIDD